MVWLSLVVFFAAIACSTLLTLTVRNLALRRGWVKSPSSSRHLHTNPIPRLGGVAIYISLLIVGGLLWAASVIFPGKIPVRFPGHVTLGILLPATLMFALGLWDDIRPLSARLKFSTQLLIGVIVFVAGFRFNAVPLLFGYDNEVGWLLSLPLTVLWILLITNAFNLLDGLDGLGAGSALFSTLTVFVVSLSGTDYFATFTCLVLAGVILGFLRYNFNPASIFLGDSGSLLIGFMLSVLALAGRQKSPTIVAVAIPVVSFGLPILETGVSVLRRFLSGQPIFTADASHIHHQLLKRGLTHRQAVVLLYAVSAVFGLLSIFLMYPGGGAVGLVLFILGLGIWMGMQHLNYPEFFELRRVARNTLDQRQVIVNNLALRRATAALFHARNDEEMRQALLDGFRDNVFDGVVLSHEGSFARWAAVPEFEWHREPVVRQKQAWSLKLQLDDTDGSVIGSFSLYLNTARPVRVDINLLTSEFRDALSIAMRRSLAELQTVPPPVTHAAAASENIA